MKITDAKVLVTSPGRNFVTLKVYTDQGIYGLGDATLNGRELAVASYLSDHLIPCLIGRDPFQSEDIWQYFYRGAYWRRGPVTMAAIGAIDIALWDIKGKTLNTPVYNLLGGKSRTGVTVYGHANGRDIEETIDEVGKYVALGYRADSRAIRNSGAAVDVWRCEGQALLRTSRKRPAAGKPVVYRKIPAACAEVVRIIAPEVWR